MWTVILLIITNVFMTIAWYGHLRFKHVDLWKVILISWLIAFVEYCYFILKALARNEKRDGEGCE